VVQLTVIADNGWEFSDWSGDLTGIENPKNITIDGNKSVTANFTQKEYSLSVTVNGSGSVSKSPDQVAYHFGDVVQLTATADTGWSFYGIKELTPTSCNSSMMGNCNNVIGSGSFLVYYVMIDIIFGVVMDWTLKLGINSFAIGRHI
jgi:uncharacterized repeat protein (TIGR02543 family)